MLLVCVYVCVRAQTEQLSGVVDGLRKKKNERKKKKECFIRYATTNLSLLVFFYIE
jgi:chemotaxis receptor (MCP) glutamine deamidase CheD